LGSAALALTATASSGLAVAGSGRCRSLADAGVDVDRCLRRDIVRRLLRRVDKSPIRGQYCRDQLQPNGPHPEHDLLLVPGLQERSRFHGLGERSSCWKPRRSTAPRTTACACSAATPKAGCPSPKSSARHSANCSGDGPRFRCRISGRSGIRPAPRSISCSGEKTPRDGFLAKTPGSQRKIATRAMYRVLPLVGHFCGLGVFARDYFRSDPRGFHLAIQVHPSGWTFFNRWIALDQDQRRFRSFLGEHGANGELEGRIGGVYTCSDSHLSLMS
jgi:hypothetical protein